MTSQRVAFERFDRGMDTRKGASVSDANRLQVLENAYVTSGLAIAKRPGLKLRFECPPDTVGLCQFEGQVVVFHHANAQVYAGFRVMALPHPTRPELKLRDVPFAQSFDGFLYVVAVYQNGNVWHHYLDGQSPSAITDPNNPRSLAVCIAGGHVFAVAGDVVRFCAVSDPDRAGSGARDWSSPDLAGFLPTGNSRNGSTAATGLGVFQKNLAVLFADGLQLWQVDPDPERMSLVSNVDSTGTRWPRTVRSTFNDLFYLSEAGFRSVGVQGFEVVERESDIGAPVDGPVKASVKALTSGATVLAGFYARVGQFWAVLGDEVWVYAFSRTSKVSAWSRYRFAVRMVALVELGGTLLVRSQSRCYTVDEDSFTDDGALIPVRVLMAYVDFRALGVLKQLQGFDAVVTGETSVQFRYDPNRPEAVTVPMMVRGDSRSALMHPMELMAVSVAPELLHAANERWQLDQLLVFFNSLGPV